MAHLTPSIVATGVLFAICLFLAGAVWSDVRQHRISNGLVLAAEILRISR